ncbi:glycosyltransferase family 4 protein [Minwuia thermotolerans]|uniref:Glycosyl transferase family 1 n=1 Tax=Minwuia thermotolerans TaxID=2056226 RepID=A0A2M9G5R1_9PROT|nr:glycosyltransferase family 4 protein [Minwuia thermotolerans]PJK31059.1 glycosyl transferase family 1 [Minwuia thermotolerans]
MRIAFYAPLKPPDHPRPSGDRAMARQMIAALRAAGHEVFLASRLRSREAAGDAAAQGRIVSQARQEAAMLAARLLEDPPDLWFTYHVYYKAPDLIGPMICERLSIPYVVAEASHSARRLIGPHAHFARAALDAIARADGVLCLTARDRAGLARIVAPEKLFDLTPFAPLRAGPRREAGRLPRRLLAVGMMRPGDKLHSYRLLARSLAGVRHLPWRLTVVGDGVAARHVRQAFAPYRGRVDFVGALPAGRLARVYRQHDLLVWPAVNEAYGMALIEASARGLPVVAGNEGGVSEVVRHGVNGLLVPPRDPVAFGRVLARVMTQRALYSRLRQRGWGHAGARHGFAAAAARLNSILGRICAS